MPAGRRPLAKPQEVIVRIHPALRAKLEALRPKGFAARCPYDAEEKAAILEFWPKKNKTDFCATMGFCKNTVQKWYRIWTEPSRET